MPLSKPNLKALFDYLDETADQGCDRTLRRTQEFLHEWNLPAEVTTDWLMDYGGGCDCEVLGNVEEAWGRTVGSSD